MENPLLIIIAALFLFLFVFGIITRLILKIKEINLKRIQNKLRYENFKGYVKFLLDKTISEKTVGFPTLANAIADYYEKYDLIFADHLQNKSRPAFVKADEIKRITLEKKQFKKEYLISKYIINYYESLFPWLREYVGFNSDELMSSATSEDETEDDPVRFYITPSEYKNLSVSQRNQKALDRYWNRNKNPWEIGRDYERYIGYKYECKGFKVEYHGINKLKEDLGRDLICSKENRVEIVQCKYWSVQKNIPIRENHITQLYGTTIKYFLDQVSVKKKSKPTLFPEEIKKHNIIPVLMATTDLSETAKDFALILGVEFHNEPMNPKYPCIKCNINFSTKEKIYHLPFDQQYDNTGIDPSRGERWVNTIKEAEELGFRRAWRWKPNDE